jgi:NAD(P)-dependent dehydrogenase (short-subunit alcohol dehydrogenase family)
VIAVARNPVEDFPADAAWIQGDVSSLEGVQAIVEQTSAILGGVDIIVNNAAGKRLYPQLDETYITNPDRVLADPVSSIELRRAWAEVNDTLTAAFDGFTLEELAAKACGSFRRGVCQISRAQPACSRNEPHQPRILSLGSGDLCNITT